MKGCRPQTLLWHSFIFPLLASTAYCAQPNGEKLIGSVSTQPADCRGEQLVTCTGSDPQLMASSSTSGSAAIEQKLNSSGHRVELQGPQASYQQERPHDPNGSYRAPSQSSVNPFNSPQIYPTNTARPPSFHSGSGHEGRNSQFSQLETQASPTLPNNPQSTNSLVQENYLYHLVQPVLIPACMVTTHLGTVFRPANVHQPPRPPASPTMPSFPLTRPPAPPTKLSAASEPFVMDQSKSRMQKMPSGPSAAKDLSRELQQPSIPKYTSPTEKDNDVALPMPSEPLQNSNKQKNAKMVNKDKLESKSNESNHEKSRKTHTAERKSSLLNDGNIFEEVDSNKPVRNQKHQLDSKFNESNDENSSTNEKLDAKINESNDEESSKTGTAEKKSSLPNDGRILQEVNSDKPLENEKLQLDSSSTSGLLMNNGVNPVQTNKEKQEDKNNQWRGKYNNPEIYRPPPVDQKKKQVKNEPIEKQKKPPKQILSGLESNNFAKPIEIPKSKGSKPLEIPESEVSSASLSEGMEGHDTNPDENENFHKSTDTEDKETTSSTPVIPVENQFQQDLASGSLQTQLSQFDEEKNPGSLITTSSSHKSRNKNPSHKKNKGKSTSSKKAKSANNKRVRLVVKEQTNLENLDKKLRPQGDELSVSNTDSPVSNLENEKQMNKNQVDEKNKNDEEKNKEIKTQNNSSRMSHEAKNPAAKSFQTHESQDLPSLLTQDLEGMKGRDTSSDQIDEFHKATVAQESASKNSVAPGETHSQLGEVNKSGSSKMEFSNLSHKIDQVILEKPSQSLKDDAENGSSNMSNETKEQRASSSHTSGEIEKSSEEKVERETGFQKAEQLTKPIIDLEMERTTSSTKASSIALYIGEDRFISSIFNKMENIKDDHQQRDKRFKVLVSHAFNPLQLKTLNEIYPRVFKDIIGYMYSTEAKPFSEAIDFKHAGGIATYKYLQPNLVNLVETHLNLSKNEDYLSLKEMDFDLYKKLQVIWFLEPEIVYNIPEILEHQLSKAEIYRRLETFVIQIRQYTSAENWNVLRRVLVREQVWHAEEYKVLEDNLQLDKIFPTREDFIRSASRQRLVNMDSAEKMSQDSLLTITLGAEALQRRDLAKHLVTLGDFLTESQLKNLEEFYKSKGCDYAEALQVSEILGLTNPSEEIVKKELSQQNLNYLVQKFKSRQDSSIVPWHESSTRHWIFQEFNGVYQSQLSVASKLFNRENYDLKDSDKSKIRSALNSSPGDFIKFSEWGLNVKILNLLSILRHSVGKKGTYKELQKQLLDDYLSVKLTETQITELEAWLKRIA